MSSVSTLHLGRTPAQRRLEGAARAWARRAVGDGVVALVDPVGETAPALAALREAGVDVLVCDEPVRAVARVALRPVRVVVACVGTRREHLPAAVQALREDLGLPVLLAYAPGDLEAAAPAIMAGAAPVLSLPLDAGDLSLRVLEAWPAPAAGGDLCIGPLCIDTGGAQATWAGRRVEMTVNELGVLTFLARRHGRVVPRDELQTLWPGSADPDGNVAAAVARLRRRLGAAGVPALVSTVRGFGYRLDVAVDAHAAATTGATA